MSPEDALLDLEAKVLRLAAGSYLDGVEELRVLLASESPALRSKLLKIIAPKMEASALRGLIDAFALGTADAIETVGDGPKTYPKAGGGRVSRAEAAAIMYGSGSAQHRKALELDTKSTGLSKETEGVFRGLDAETKKAIAQARVLLAAGASPEAALAPVFASATRIQRAVTWGVNAAYNDAVTSVATGAGKEMVWVAERDACVHCLAYQGERSKDGFFPEGLTYGKKPLKHESKPRCPLHPNCRCRLQVLNDPSYADSLRREADRSVLRGFSLPSESGQARVDAAQRLIAKGVNAPKSVIDYARKAVKEGGFEKRNVPGGSATR